MAFPTDAKQHLANAERLMQAGDVRSLRYAALELRFALELMTYEKLRQLRQYLPPTFLARTWQPPQLLKAMTQVDSLADRSFELHMGKAWVDNKPPENDEFVKLGEHKTVTVDWLRKHYNALGSWLHAIEGDSDPPIDSMRTRLEQVAGEVATALSGSITSFAAVIGVSKIDCSECGNLIAASARYLDANERAECLNPDCAAPYRVEKVGDEYRWSLDGVRVDCKKCSAKILLRRDALREGGEFKCGKCGARHGLRAEGWKYGVIQS